MMIMMSYSKPVVSYGILLVMVQHVTYHCLVYSTAGLLSGPAQVKLDALRRPSELTWRIHRSPTSQKNLLLFSDSSV